MCMKQLINFSTIDCVLAVAFAFNYYMDVIVKNTI